MSSDVVTKRILCIFLLIGLWIGMVSTAEDTRTIECQIVGPARMTTVWLGVIEESAQANWNFVESDRIQIDIPASVSSSIIAVAKGWHHQIVQFEVGDSVEQCKIRLSAGFSVKGTVHSREGWPLRQARITSTPVDIGGISLPEFTKPSWSASSSGEFTLRGMNNGRYELEVTADGYIPLKLKNIFFRENHIVRLSIELSEAYFVSGKVVGPQGMPVSGIEVRGRWLDRKVGTVERDGVVQNRLQDSYEYRRDNIMTDTNGEFKLGPIPEGARVDIWTNLEAFGSFKQQVVVAPTDNLVLELRHDSVRGTVVDELSGVPIENFEVTGYRGRGAAHESHHIRNSGGNFILPLHADTQALSIKTKGYAPWIIRHLTSSGGEVDLDVVYLRRSRVVSGRVLNALSGRPILGALVRRSERHYSDRYLSMVFGNHLKSDHRAYTDADGKFELGGLSPDEDLVEVWISGKGRRDFKVPPGTKNVDFEMSFGGAVSGWLTLPDGTPAEGTVRLQGPNLPKQTDVAKDGSFTLEGLTSGGYELVAMSDAGVVAPLDIMVREGEWMQNVHLVIEPGFRVTGEISGLNDSELVEIRVRNMEGKTVLTRWFENGEFFLQGVPHEATILAKTTNDLVLTRRVRFDDQHNAQVHFRFDGSSTLIGSVKARGQSLDGFELRISPRDRVSPTAFTATTENGTYSVHGLYDGHYSVNTSTGYSFDVVVAGRSIFDIELPAISLTGKVRTEISNKKISEGFVALKRIDSIETFRIPVLRTRIRSDGTFSFNGLTKGIYELQVSHTNFKVVRQRVKISGEETIEILLK